MVISMPVFKLDLNAGVRLKLLESTVKKMTAHTNVQMAKNVEVNTPTRYTNSLSLRTTSVELKSYSKW
jgi:hypothetical protein